MSHFGTKKHKSTKKFFWAITTQTELFVSGYVREFSEPTTPDSIKLLISKFSSTLFIDTKILKFSEIDSMLSLLSNQWNNMNLHLTLLHRGSENNFNIKHLVTEILEELDEFIVLFHTNHGHVFGIYKRYETTSSDEKGYEFVIRSKNHYLPKVFGAKGKHRKNWIGYGGDTAIQSQNCFIVFPQNDAFNALCAGRTGFSANQLCGGNDSKLCLCHFAFQFDVLEYEVFARKCDDSLLSQINDVLDDRVLNDETSQLLKNGHW